MLGFSLGGFFDGILLHQVLQWHHLLSGVTEAKHDIRVLILADGLFHVFMYAVAVIGLWLLWRGNRASAAGDHRHTPANALVGFGVWHVVDALLSHWILGIHRIRMDVDNPLIWDLGWLAAFGITPLVWGLAIRQHGKTTNKLMSSPLALTFAVLASGIGASLPVQNDGPTMVLFGPGTTPHAAMSAMQSLGGLVVWTDPSQQLWAVKMSGGADPMEFYGRGAILVGHSIFPAGCFNWLRPSEA